MINSKQHPRKMVIYGADGLDYTYLLKASCVINFGITGCLWGYLLFPFLWHHMITHVWITSDRNGSFRVTRTCDRTRE